MHVRGKDIIKAVNGSSLGIVVSEGAVVSLPISLDKVVDV